MSKLLDTGLVSKEDYEEEVARYNDEVRRITKGMPKARKRALVTYAHDLLQLSEYTGSTYKLIERFTTEVSICGLK